MHSGLSLTGMGSGLWLMIWSMDHEIVWLDNLMRFLMKVKYWLSTDRHVHRRIMSLMLEIRSLFLESLFFP